MEAQFLQDGLSIDYTPSSAVTAGDVIVEGNLIGIAKTDIAANTLGALAVSGVFRVVKATGVTYNKGDLVYWNATTGATKTTSDTLMGVAVKKAGAELYVDVLIYAGENAMAAIQTAINATISGLEVDDIGRKVVSKDADVTSPALTAAELKSGMILAAKTSAQTLTLPTAAAALAGVICTFVRTGHASAMTITDGVLTHNSADAVGDCVTVGCTGAAWYVVSSTIA